MSHPLRFRRRLDRTISRFHARVSTSGASDYRRSGLVDGIQSFRAPVILFLVAAALSCGPRNARLIDQFQPARPGSCQLEVRSFPRNIAIGSDLLARYVLTNISDDWVRGCVSIQRRWTFLGTDDTTVIERTGTHVICSRDEQFFLGEGESYSWLDAVTVPEVGEGTAEVAVEVDIVLLDPKGEAPWEHLFTARTSFEVDIEETEKSADRSG